MRKAIITKYLGPTNTRGSRYKASGHDGVGGSIMISADDGVNYTVNHARAAQALAEKLGWDGLWVAGGCDWKGGRGFVFVNVKGVAIDPGPALKTYDAADAFVVAKREG